MSQVEARSVPRPEPPPGTPFAYTGSMNPALTMLPPLPARASLQFALLGPAVILGSRLLMQVLNHVEIDGLERFRDARARGRGLLTWSNHVSILDDPFLTCLLTRLDYAGTRWVGGDAKNFFGNSLSAWFFGGGKVVPIHRGQGIDQPGMHFLRDRLLAGDWVHFFPEGGRTRDPLGRMLPAFKPGFGWLIDETRPLSLGFYHYGMSEVLPIVARVPRIGRTVRMVFDEVTDWREEQGWQGDARERAQMVSERCHRRLAAIEARVHPAASAR